VTAFLSIWPLIVSGLTTKCLPPTISAELLPIPPDSSQLDRQPPEYHPPSEREI
jgi:hypothetical protein